MAVLPLAIAQGLRWRFAETPPILAAESSDMGFSGAELEMRTRLFVVYHSMDLGLFDREEEDERYELIKRHHALPTRP